MLILPQGLFSRIFKTLLHDMPQKSQRLAGDRPPLWHGVGVQRTQRTAQEGARGAPRALAFVQRVPLLPFTAPRGAPAVNGTSGGRPGDRHV